MNKEELKKHATALILAGIHIMPVRTNKTPILTGWTAPDFTVDEATMFAHIDAGHQLGIITGELSAITVIDIDYIADGVFGTDPNIFPDTYTVRTPSGAIQKYYEYDPLIRQSQKAFKKYPNVDIRNDGGQVVAVPSHCVYDKTYHDGSSRHIVGDYEVVSGSILSLAPFPRELFAEYLSNKKEEKPHTPHTPDPARPGDDFEQSVPWSAILSPFGWKEGHTDRTGTTHWTRPDKKGDATSATTRRGNDGRERFFPFSTASAPFVPYDPSLHNSYTKITAYATLHHGGDFAKTIADLRSQGYGIQRVTPEEHKESASNATPGLVTQCLADIEERPIEWVWRGKIACGELCIIAGEPGAGKTMITADLTARITRGDLAPFSEEPMRQGSVIYLTSENDPARVLRPRLRAAGADLRRVHIIESSLTKEENGKKMKRHVALHEDAQAIGEAIKRIPDTVALIIDPISEYMGKKDANNNGDVRDVLATLGEHVRDKDVAIIAVTHFNKKVEISNASSRINGSIGFAGAARTAFAVGKYVNDEWSDEEKEQNRKVMAFTFAKNNLSADAGGYTYKIRSQEYTSSLGEKIETASIEWLAEIEDSADEILAHSAKKQGRPRKERDQCALWLEGVLMKYPEGVKRSDVILLGERDGFSRATVDRASQELPILRDDGTWTLLAIPNTL